MKKFILLLISFLLILGCTVTKRVHQKGYHIKWNKLIDKSTSNKSIEGIKFNNLDKVISFEDKHIIPYSHIETKDSADSPNSVKSRTKISKKSSTVAKSDIYKLIHTAIHTDNMKKAYVTKIDDDEKQQNNPKKRKIPLVIFLVIILLLMVPFSIISLVLGLVIWAGISGMFGYALIAEILGGLLGILSIVLIFYSLFYLFFLLFYSNDPYYKNDNSKFRKDFWKLASWMLLILLLTLAFFIWLISF